MNVLKKEIQTLDEDIIINLHKSSDKYVQLMSTNMVKLQNALAKLNEHNDNHADVAQINMVNINE